MNILFERASIEDAEEILNLQKLAYISEAEIINDFSIPPLKQTLAEIQSEFENHIFLKIRYKNKIIASVRVSYENETCFIGKLIVHPDLQNTGIGSKLLHEAEKQYPDAKRFELFTGQKSERNLYIYQKYGYRIFKSKAVSDKLKLIFLEKLK